MAYFDIRNPSKVVFFADGSIKRGYGHLYRVKNLSNLLKVDKSSVFIYENEWQLNFYKQHNMHTISLNELVKSNKEFDLFFIDSKQKLNKPILDIRSKKKILIDPCNNNHELIDISITPSFYSKDILRCGKKSNHLFGEDFVILDPKIYRLNHMDKKNNKLILSFGGSDPNNIALKLLKDLSDTKYINDITLILGPGYPHDKRKLINFIDSDQILFNPKNIFKIFLEAYLVITALGVTIQELGFLNINTAVLYNYDNDRVDAEIIDEYFKENSLRNKFFNLGHHKEYNIDGVIKSIEICRNSSIVNGFSTNFGSAWRDD